MKRFLNFKFLLLLVVGTLTYVLVSATKGSEDEDSDDYAVPNAYGDPDGHVSDGSTASFVD